MKYQLKHAINVGNSQLTELTLRDYAIASDLLAFDSRGAAAQRIQLIANVSGTDKAVIERLHVQDYFALDAIVEGLLTQTAVPALGKEPNLEGKSDATKKQ